MSQSPDSDFMRALQRFVKACQETTPQMREATLAWLVAYFRAEAWKRDAEEPEPQ